MSLLSPSYRGELFPGRTSLPDIVIYPRGDVLGLVLGEWWTRERFIQSIQNEDPHLSLRTRVLQPPRHWREKTVEGRKQGLTGLFQTRSILLADTVLEQQIKES